MLTDTGSEAMKFSDLDLDRDDLSQALSNGDQDSIDEICAHLVDRAREFDTAAIDAGSGPLASTYSRWAALFTMGADTLERIALAHQRDS